MDFEDFLLDSQGKEQEERTLHSVTGEGSASSTVPEDFWSAVDFARLNFKNIDPPYPDLELGNLKIYYWICHAFDELCRRTGSRVEFTVGTNPSGTVQVRAWCREGDRIQSYLPNLIKIMEAEDVDALSSHDFCFPDYVVTADPLREAEYRNTQRKS